MLDEGRRQLRTVSHIYALCLRSAAAPSLPVQCRCGAPEPNFTHRAPRARPENAPGRRPEPSITRQELSFAATGPEAEVVFDGTAENIQVAPRPRPFFHK
ncbi:hypothetical protein NDU88_004638 [Pleurodeles waltl]|uniref:Uncharacterized protein n=1 Tax=Pleurodeles waltl TaxID=8319 RepID=A0AAV7QFF2_PLEWA|nr:hypothetical protein NDU88_004638 [Pleurodeles waltl]